MTNQNDKIRLQIHGSRVQTLYKAVTLRVTIVGAVDSTTETSQL